MVRKILYFNVGSMKQNYKVEFPEFQFKESKVRVLSTMSLDLVSALQRLVTIYNARNLVENYIAVREFVVFVSCDLSYPVEVCPTPSKDKCI